MMNSRQAVLARRNLDRRLTPAKSEAMFAPPGGWVKAVREALGMTTRQLAERMGVARSRVSAIEKAESGGAITLGTLREAAEAMNCTLVYAIVPTTTLEDILRDQAQAKADAELARLHHTMRLEAQAMDRRDLAAERERLAREMLSGSLRRIWDKE